MKNEVRLIDANNPYIPKYFSEHDRERFLSGLILQSTVDAAPVVHARWEDVRETVMYVPDKKATLTHTAETCSACKARVGFVGPKIYLYDKHCPECGAVMDLGKNGP